MASHRQETKEEIASLRQEMLSLRQELKEEIASLRQEYKEDFRALNARIDQINTRLDQIIHMIAEIKK